MDHKNDPGGATKFGISLRLLQRQGDLDGDGYLDGDLDGDGDVDAEDVKLLTIEEAENVYRHQWWERYNYGWIESQALATRLLCLSVHAGPKAAHLALQQAICKHSLIKVDGLLGPNTRAAANMLPAPWVVTEFKHETAAHYQRLIDKNAKLLCFRRGWMNRAYS